MTDKKMVSSRVKQKMGGNLKSSLSLKGSAYFLCKAELYEAIRVTFITV